MYIAQCSNVMVPASTLAWKIMKYLSRGRLKLKHTLLTSSHKEETTWHLIFWPPKQRRLNAWCTARYVYCRCSTESILGQSSQVHSGMKPKGTVSSNHGYTFWITSKIKKNSRGFENVIGHQFKTQGFAYIALDNTVNLCLLMRFLMQVSTSPQINSCMQLTLNGMSNRSWIKHGSI